MHFSTQLKTIYALGVSDSVGFSHVHSPHLRFVSSHVKASYILDLDSLQTFPTETIMSSRRITFVATPEREVVMHMRRHTATPTEASGLHREGASGSLRSSHSLLQDPTSRPTHLKRRMVTEGAQYASSTAATSVSSPTSSGGVSYYPTSLHKIRRQREKDHGAQMAAVDEDRRGRRSVSPSNRKLSPAATRGRDPSPAASGSREEEYDGGPHRSLARLGQGRTPPLGPRHPNTRNTPSSQGRSVVEGLRPHRATLALDGALDSSAPVAKVTSHTSENHPSRVPHESEPKQRKSSEGASPTRHVPITILSTKISAASSLAKPPAPQAAAPPQPTDLAMHHYFKFNDSAVSTVELNVSDASTIHLPPNHHATVQAPPFSSTEQRMQAGRELQSTPTPQGRFSSGHHHRCQVGHCQLNQEIISERIALETAVARLQAELQLQRRELLLQQQSQSLTRGQQVPSPPPSPQQTRAADPNSSLQRELEQQRSSIEFQQRVIIHLEEQLERLETVNTSSSYINAHEGTHNSYALGDGLRYVKSTSHATARASFAAAPSYELPQTTSPTSRAELWRMNIEQKLNNINSRHKDNHSRTESRYVSHDTSPIHQTNSHQRESSAHTSGLNISAVSAYSNQSEAINNNSNHNGLYHSVEEGMLPASSASIPGDALPQADAVKGIVTSQQHGGAGITDVHSSLHYHPPPLLSVPPSLSNIIHDLYLTWGEVHRAAEDTYQEVHQIQSPLLTVRWDGTEQLRSSSLSSVKVRTSPSKPGVMMVDPTKEGRPRQGHNRLPSAPSSQNDNCSDDTTVDCSVSHSLHCEATFSSSSSSYSPYSPPNPSNGGSTSESPAQSCTRPRQTIVIDMDI